MKVPFTFLDTYSAFATDCVLTCWTRTAFKFLFSCGLGEFRKKIPRVFQEFSMVKNLFSRIKTTSSIFSHSGSNWNWVYINCKKVQLWVRYFYRFWITYKIDKTFSTKLQAFSISTALEITCFSRSFAWPWKKISKFQEFCRNSRSSEHHGWY